MKSARSFRIFAGSLGLAGSLFVGPSASAAIKQEIPPLRPPHAELPPVANRRDLLPWLIGAASVSFIASFFLWPRHRAQPVVEPPAARAARELRALTSPAPAEVSRILREHLVQVFHLPGPGATTEEIDAVLEGQTELSTRVREFLSRCDTFKFAPDHPPLTGDLVEEALLLIEETQASRRRVEAIAAP